MADNSFPVGIRNGLITGEHRRRMGIAVWEFMWLVDHVTEEYQAAGGEIRGRVLGGTRIPASRIAQEMEVSEDTVYTSLKRLDLAGYIAARRITNGFRIEVRNSKKWRPSDALPPSVATSPKSGDNGILGFGTLPESPDPANPETLVTSIDNAVGLDIAENNASSIQEEDAPAREATERWKQAAAVAGRGKPAGFRDALERCRPLRIEAETVVVELPDDQADRNRIEDLGTALRNALRMNTPRPLALVLIDPNKEARAGPEVSPDAADAASP